MDIGVQMRKWRYDCRVTQQQLADRCGYSLRAVQKWEAGERIPGCDALVALSNAMGVSTDWLLGLTDSWERNSSGRIL